MIPDLMPVGDDGFNRVGVVFDAPGRDEKALFQAELAVGFQNARNGDIGAIAQHRDRRQLVFGASAMVDMNQTVGIHIQGDRTGDLGTVRPGDGSLQHHFRALPISSLRRHWG